jgi:hypothetical protein
MIINFQYPNVPAYQRDITVNDVNRLIMMLKSLFNEVKRFSKKNLKNKRILAIFINKN